MGVSSSVEVVADGDDEEEEEERDDEEEEDRGDVDRRRLLENHLVKKVLEQEPEMLPLHASASPLSPQLSSLGTPRLGPSIKVWDPYNVLAPPPPPPAPVFSRSYSGNGMVVEEEGSVMMEVYLISHGECELNLRPDLVAGRCPEAGLTMVGKRQARALAVFLNSQGVRFSAVYSSPLERARATAVSVCQQMNFAEEQIQASEALVDMSHGHWEGCPRSEVFTPEILSLIDRLRPDFSAPSGESIRQVNFRMVQFINEAVLCLPEKLRSEFSSPHPVESHQVYQNHNSSLHEQDGPSHSQPHWDLLHKHRQISRKKSGKSRLQFVTSTGNHDSADEFSPQDSSHSNHQSPIHDISVTTSSPGIPSIGIFTHSMPIKCLLTGILECSPVMTNKICIEDSSITVIQHSWKTGWQIKRLNDIAHLRLL